MRIPFPYLFHNVSVTVTLFKHIYSHPLVHRPKGVLLVLTFLRYSQRDQRALPVPFVITVNAWCHCIRCSASVCTFSRLGQESYQMPINRMSIPHKSCQSCGNEVECLHSLYSFFRNEDFFVILAHSHRVRKKTCDRPSIVFAVVSTVSVSQFYKISDHSATYAFSLYAKMGYLRTKKSIQGSKRN